MLHQFIKALRWTLVFGKDQTFCVTLLVWFCASVKNVLPYPLTLKQCSCDFLYPLQIDASHNIYGVTKFMSSIAIFSVQQIHYVLLATLFDSVPRTTKLPILTFHFWWSNFRGFRMDDLSVSTDTLEEAKKLHQDLQTVLASGVFNLKPN